MSNKNTKKSMCRTPVGTIKFTCELTGQVMELGVESVNDKIMMIPRFDPPMSDEIPLSPLVLMWNEYTNFLVEKNS